jgi:hypothetical protein
VITGHDLIECVKAMSDTERQELARLVYLGAPNSTSCVAVPSESGLEFNARFFANLEAEQKAQWQRSSLLGE